jgi:hypothetical protein
MPNRHGSQEIYGIKIPPGLVGKSYLALWRDLLDLGGQGIHVIPIALSRQGQTFVNPSYRQPYGILQPRRVQGGAK